ncbi:MAG: Acg family FMN-binding oxidoreductase [Elstera sp.]
MAPTNRRRFLKWTLGGFAAFSTAAVVGGVGISLIPNAPAVAIAPWQEAGRGRDPRERALSYAALAPNPHNLQSWLIELVGDDRMRLYVDRSRLLPETDPFSRQIVIGQGCFLETLALGAGIVGYRAEVSLFPNGSFTGDGVDHRPVADVRFVAGGQADPLAQAIQFRRSVKEPFDMKRLPSAGQLRALTALSTPAVRLDATTAPDQVARLRGLLYEGMEIETRLPRTFLESVKLMRIGSKEIAQHRDGIDIGGGMLEVLARTGMITREAMADPTSSSFQTGLDMYKAMTDATPALIWLTTPGNSRADQIAAGRAYQRLALSVTQAGLALHPMSQLLQEYPEMAGAQQRLLAELGTKAPERVQMLARIGYGPEVPPAPRRDPASLIAVGPKLSMVF